MSTQTRERAPGRHSEHQTGMPLSAQRREREAAQRLARLQEATARLASALTPTEVCELLLGLADEMLDAVAGVVYLADEEGVFRLHAWRGAVSPTRWSMLPPDTPLPLATALRTGVPEWFENHRQLLDAYPNLRDTPVPSQAIQSVAALPMVHGGKVIGGFAFSFATPRQFDEDQRAWLASLGGQCTQALERARLYVAERRARTEAETICRVVEALNVNQLDLEALVQRVVDETTALVGAEHGAFLDAAGPDPGAPPAGLPPLASQLSVPVVSRSGETLGSLCLGHSQPGRFTREHERLARSIASSAATAIDNAKLFQATREAEEQHKRLAEELAETVRVNELFAGVLAHDLRNPLGAIMAGVQLLMMREREGGDDGGESSARTLERVERCAQRMTRMVDQLLDVSRVRLGDSASIDARPMDLVPLLSQLVSELRASHPQARLALARVTGDTRGRWDEDRLAQVFSNLLGNALQHGDAAREVEVRIDGSAGGEVVTEVHSGGHLPAEQLATLFAPLSARLQARRSRGRTHKGGLGLGLFIVHEMVRAHAGRVEAESDAQRGTVFRVILPREAS